MGAILSGFIKSASDNKGKPYDEVFLELIEITFKCWLWKGARSSTGYGNFHNDGAHRISFLLAHGEIPKNKWILHHCDNPPCVNPTHLYAGTKDDNERDKVIRKRVPPHPGELSYNHKLTNEIVKEIRSFQGKLSEIKTAKKFNISHSHIGLIWRRERWGNI